VGVEEALQNQHGSDLVDDFAMAGEGSSGSMQVPMGFCGGEALVPEMDGKRKGFAERFREGLGFGGLRAQVAGHVEWIAEDDGFAAELAEEAAEGFEVLLRIFVDKGENGLCGEAELIGDGDTDAATAEIESEVAGGHGHRMILMPGW
jgi:hypothetical protein